MTFEKPEGDVQEYFESDCLNRKASLSHVPLDTSQSHAPLDREISQNIYDGKNTFSLESKILGTDQALDTAVRNRISFDDYNDYSKKKSKREEIYASVQFDEFKSKCALVSSASLEESHNKRYFTARRQSFPKEEAHSFQYLESSKNSLPSFDTDSTGEMFMFRREKSLLTIVDASRNKATLNHDKEYYNKKYRNGNGEGRREARVDRESQIVLEIENHETRTIDSSSELVKNMDNEEIADLSIVGDAELHVYSKTKIPDQFIHEVSSILEQYRGKIHPRSNITDGLGLIYSLYISFSNGTGKCDLVYRLSVVTADLFRDAVRNVELNSAELSYSYLHTTYYRLPVGIPVYVNGVIYRKDRRQELLI